MTEILFRIPFCLSGIDVELARSIEEKIMLEDAQSWMNGRSINEIKDKSGTLSMLLFVYALHVYRICKCVSGGSGCSENKVGLVIASISKVSN